MIPLTISVPANLLLCGEYVILTKGGTGIGLAIDRHLTLSIHRSPVFMLRTLIGTTVKGYTNETIIEDPMLYGAMLHFNISKGFSSLWPQAIITIDSREFFSQGKKLGLGSSAACAVAITVAILFAVTKKCPSKHDVFTHALAIHRKFQNGKGSGYDVACSTFGGSGVFTGGEIPTFSPLPLPPFLSSFHLIDSPARANTSSAITAWKEFIARQPRLWDTLRAQSVFLTKQMTHAQTALEFLDHLKRHALLGIQLGNALNIPATVPSQVQANFPDILIKACGAGNETLIAFCKHGLGTHLRISKVGFTCR